MLLCILAPSSDRNTHRVDERCAGLSKVKSNLDVEISSRHTADGRSAAPVTAAHVNGSRRTITYTQTSQTEELSVCDIRLSCTDIITERLKRGKMLTRDTQLLIDLAYY